MHRARAVLEAIESKLKAAATPAGDNVYLARLADLELEDLPALDILPASDSPVSELGADNNHYIDSVLRVFVDIHDYSKESNRALLDQIFELRSACHAAILADPGLGLSFGAVARYQGTEELAFQIGDVRLASYRTVFDVWYRMGFSSPEV